MKARITKQGTRSDGELLAFQTDLGPGDRSLSIAVEPNTDAKGRGAADQQSSRVDQGKCTHAEQDDGTSEVERSEGHTSQACSDCQALGAANSKWQLHSTRKTAAAAGA